MFGSFFELGIRHIMDLHAYDHMLFIAVLVAPYAPGEWRKILVLVTAFTIGHSISLALATLDIVSANMSIIEFLIPVTILITAIINFFPSKKPRFAKWAPALLVTFFGLIHGLGFSSYLSQLLGSSGNIAVPLLAFNLGVEAGQIAIVFIFLAVGSLFTLTKILTFRHWNMAVSAAAALVSLHLASLAKFW